MSFPMLVITPDVAFVANDIRHYSLLPIFPPLYVDDRSKLTVLDNAWFTGGPSGGFQRWATRNLLAPDGIRDMDVLQHLHESIPMPEVSRRFNAPRELLLVQSDPDGLAAYSIDCDARTIGRLKASTIYHGLPFTWGDMDAIAEVERLCRDTWAAVTRVHCGGLMDLLRMFGRLFADAYRICGPDGAISEAMEFGLLIRVFGDVWQRRIGPVASRMVAESSDAELDALLSPPTTPTPRRPATPKVDRDAIERRSFGTAPWEVPSEW